MRLDSFTLDPAQTQTTAVLHIDGLDMGALAKLTHLDKLDVTGRLGGKIPIVLEGGKFAIRGGPTRPGRAGFPFSRQRRPSCCRARARKST